MSTTRRRLPLLEHLDRRGTLALAPEWDHLVAESASGSPFLSWAWIGGWLETLGRNADLEVVTARDPLDGRLLGVAPFTVVDKRRLGLGYRSLTMIGNGPAAPDHLDMPIVAGRADEIAPLLWEAIDRGRRWDVIDLDGVAADGPLARVALRRDGDDRYSRLIPCPYLPLDGGWEGVEERMGSGHRQNIRRYRRKLDAEASGVTERLVASEDDLPETMSRLAEMHQTIRSRHGHRGAFAEPSLVEFHNEVARRMLAAGRLRLWRLEANGKVIAAINCFRFRDTVAFYSTGYDPKWAKYGPGRRIMATAIQGAIDEGATEFDFLRGHEEYKTAWGAELRHDVRIHRAAGDRGRLLWTLRTAASPFKQRVGRPRT